MSKRLPTALAVLLAGAAVAVAVHQLRHAGIPAWQWAAFRDVGILFTAALFYGVCLFLYWLAGVRAAIGRRHK